jgi:hypothetical protein
MLRAQAQFGRKMQQEQARMAREELPTPRKLPRMPAGQAQSAE